MKRSSAEANDFVLWRKGVLLGEVCGRGRNKSKGLCFLKGVVPAGSLESSLGRTVIGKPRGGHSAE